MQMSFHVKLFHYFPVEIHLPSCCVWITLFIHSSSLSLSLLLPTFFLFSRKIGTRQSSSSSSSDETSCCFSSSNYQFSASIETFLWCFPLLGRYRRWIQPDSVRFFSKGASRSFENFEPLPTPSMGHRLKQSRQPTRLTHYFWLAPLRIDYSNRRMAIRISLSLSLRNCDW